MLSSRQSIHREKTFHSFHEHQLQPDPRPKYLHTGMCASKSFDLSLAPQNEIKHATPGIGALPNCAGAKVTARNVRRFCKDQYANKSPLANARML